MKRSIDEEEEVVVEDTVVGKRERREPNFIFNQTLKLVPTHSFSFLLFNSPFTCFQALQHLPCSPFLLLGFVLSPLHLSFHFTIKFSIFISVSQGTTQFGCYSSIFSSLNYIQLLKKIHFFGFPLVVCILKNYYEGILFLSSWVIEKCILFIIIIEMSYWSLCYHYLIWFIVYQLLLGIAQFWFLHLYVFFVLVCLFLIIA